ncbi:MAG: hypothetical protein V4619_12755, partial [Bacteroidota bacterium]
TRPLLRSGTLSSPSAERGVFIFLFYNFLEHFQTLFTRSEERVAQRSVRRVSPRGGQVEKRTKR